MHRSLAIKALTLCALSSAALAGGNDAPATVRGYTLSGEVLLYSAGDQRLPAGWSVACESKASSIKLRGLSEAIFEGNKMHSLFSQALPSDGGQLVIADEDGDTIGLGDMQVSFVGKDWYLHSTSSEMSGKPIFEVAAESRQVIEREDGSLAFVGEIDLSNEALAELGVDSSAEHFIGNLMLIATPFVGPARPFVPQPDAGDGINPVDIVVSTIGTTITRNGSVGGVSAYSMTTVSCNIGDVDAIWIDCSTGPNCNKHPVIGQELYRLQTTAAGYKQLRQIGMSWLKHGFCAADAPSCTNLVPGSTYIPNGSCDWLGSFATDTYSDGLNAQQSNLGPRSDINAWTGLFTYPFPVPAAPWNTCTTAPGGTASICRRTQVRESDLNPTTFPNSIYAAEVVYITTDEAGPQRYNNYSVRRLNTPAGAPPYTLSFSGSTIVYINGVHWWAQNDTGVTVVNVDVPGDGRFEIAYKTTNIGGGQYHYEYVVHNNCSDRSAQAISFPLPPGAVTSSESFADVDYHSGEPYSGTDWTRTVTPSTSIEWATVPHSTNTNANALRWSTAYSFSFDCNTAPVQGNATLTLFKPGTPGFVTALVDVPGPLSPALSYCTAKINSVGCTPEIYGIGTSSATATSGFTLNAKNIVSNKIGFGLYQISTAGSGQAATPFSGGFLCVSGSPNRTTPVLSGGNPPPDDCSGLFSIDLNSFAQGLITGPPFPQAYLLVNGQEVCAQFWGRDPGFAPPNNTQLTDGLIWTVGP